MCYPVKCPKCGKTTWAGCGLHKDMVMAKVPPEERCTCERENEVKNEPKEEVLNVESTIKHIKTVEEMQQILKDDKDQLVVIDYYSTTCVPCKRMEPVFEGFNKNYGNKAYFYKVNGSESTDILEKYDICAFPSFGFYKNGEQIEVITGEDRVKLENTIKANI